MIAQCELKQMIVTHLYENWTYSFGVDVAIPPFKDQAPILSWKQSPQYNLTAALALAKTSTASHYQPKKKGLTFIGLSANAH